MRATDLSELAAFDAVARHRSFRRAGEERGVTASAISHAVSNLEARVGIRLLSRTTRSVSLTDAGAMLLSRLSPAFADRLVTTKEKARIERKRTRFRMALKIARPMPKLLKWEAFKRQRTGGKALRGAILGRTPE